MIGGIKMRGTFSLPVLMILALMADAPWAAFAGAFEDAVAAEKKHDFWTAVEKYEAAAEGNAAAQSRLGMMYAIGEGVRVNDVEAYMWFIIAAEHGGDTERRRRDIMAKRMYDFEITKGKKMAADWLSKYQKGS
jgi:TPR repeat protein